MADNPITVPLAADLPENWTYGQTVAPTGGEVGLSKQHGYNYLMEQANATQRAVKEIGEAFSGLASLGPDGKVPDEQLPAMNYDPAGSASAVQKNLDAHTGNRENPHGVTAQQVGAAIEYTKLGTISTLDELLSKRPSGFYGVVPPATGFPKSDYWNVVMWADERVPSSGEYTRTIYASPVNGSEVWQLQITNSGNKGWTRLVSTKGDSFIEGILAAKNFVSINADKSYANLIAAGNRVFLETYVNDNYSVRRQFLIDSIEKTENVKDAVLISQTKGSDIYEQFRVYHEGNTPGWMTSYVGTGTNSVTLTFPFAPKIVLFPAVYRGDDSWYTGLGERGYSSYGFSILIPEISGSRLSNPALYLDVTNEGKTFTWRESSASDANNSAGKTYYVLAF